jgi:CheY-like chemotaxis protein
MNVKNWTVCVIEPNKFEGQIMLDLLRNAGVERVKMFTDAETAAGNLELYHANIIIATFEMGALDGAAWTRAFRRNPRMANRRAAVYITSSAFSRAMAEECRHAGANALIGKPISAKVLLATINKVLAHPRSFIEAAGYVGPCRRAGIVTAGGPKKRRQADATPPAAEVTLQQAVEGLAAASAELLNDPTKVQACEAALRLVQDCAVNAGDGPLLRACAAFSLQLGANKSLPPAVARVALDACVSGVIELAAMPAAETQKREAIAEDVRHAVAKAAMQRAA